MILLFIFLDKFQGEKDKIIWKDTCVNFFKAVRMNALVENFINNLLG